MTTTIAVSEETRDLLKKLGSKSETYDEIIRKALDIAQEKIFTERQERILKTEEFVSIDELWNFDFQESSEAV